MPSEITYDEFETQWLNDIKENNLSSVEKGHRFALKLISQWLDFSEDTEDIFYCDGASDGGIDIAYLQREEDDLDDDANSGHIWYIVQSKYGTAFSGKETLLLEAQKAIDTLQGKNTRLSSTSADVVNRIAEFRKKASDNDRLVFVIATCRELSLDEKQTLDDIRLIGQKIFGSLFDIESVSINTIYNRVMEASPDKKKVAIKAELVTSGDDLLVGSVKIMDLYTFLKDYKKQTNDLDLIYEKNVRKFLGNKKKVNKEIHNTLDKFPERFGLYNNGITIVVEDFKNDPANNNKYYLIEPYIVNGCQTTKTIWEVLDPKLNSGGTGIGSFDDWRIRLEKGIVVVKVVKIGENGEELLIDTTRFTNSQNAVAPRDFLALEKSFQSWKQTFADEYNIYLEIQRGGWDAQRAMERNNPLLSKHFSIWTRAFDLLKIHGAGWMGNPGLAYGKNPPFAPGGSVFKKVISSDYGFTKDDLYATYLLNALTGEIKFGRGAEKKSRGQTKYLFCFIIVELLKYCMDVIPIEKTNANVSRAVIKVFSDLESDAAKALSEGALTVIDDYMSQSEESSLYNEDAYNGDSNAFLKNDSLGKKEFSPLLVEVITIEKKTLKKNGDVGIVENAIKD
jgi:predicted kinase